MEIINTIILWGLYFPLKLVFKEQLDTTTALLVYKAIFICLTLINIFRYKYLKYFYEMEMNLIFFFTMSTSYLGKIIAFVYFGLKIFIDYGMENKSLMYKDIALFIVVFSILIFLKRIMYSIYMLIHYYGVFCDKITFASDRRKVDREKR